MIEIHAKITITVVKIGEPYYFIIISLLPKNNVTTAKS